MTAPLDFPKFTNSYRGPKVLGSIGRPGLSRMATPAGPPGQQRVVDQQCLVHSVLAGMSRTMICLTSLRAVAEQGVVPRFKAVQTQPPGHNSLLTVAQCHCCPALSWTGPLCTVLVATGPEALLLLP